MIELPLFPLNTVLFPGMPLKLYIFEDRYKLMITHCLESQQPFGVVLIETGDEANNALAQPKLIGTTAHILDHQKLPFGRMNIMAVGQDRFRINSISYDKPYLTGMVDYLPFIQDDLNTIKMAERQLRPLLTRYLGALGDAGFQIEDAKLPNDAMALGYLAAVILQTDATHKQKLLETVNTSQLFANLVSSYKREVALLNVMLAPPADQQESDSPFSVN